MNIHKYRRMCVTRKRGKLNLPVSEQNKCPLVARKSIIHGSNFHSKNLAIKEIKFLDIVAWPTYDIHFIFLLTILFPLCYQNNNEYSLFFYQIKLWRLWIEYLRSLHSWEGVSEEIHETEYLGLASVWWPLIFIHGNISLRFQSKRCIASTKPEGYNNSSRDREDYADR